MESKLKHMYNNCLEHNQIHFVRQDPSLLRFIDFPSKRVQLTAVRSSPLAIQYIKHPSVKVQFAAAKKAKYQYLFELKMLYDLITYTEAKKRVEKLINNIKLEYVDKSDDQLVEIIKNTPEHIYNIENPSAEVQLKIIKINMGTIPLINVLGREAQLHVVNDAEVYEFYRAEQLEKLIIPRLDEDLANIMKQKIKCKDVIC